MNTCVISGNLARDPELRATKSGHSVTRMTIATNDRTKRGDEWVADPAFVGVVLWGRQAELANQYLRKGSKATVLGRLKSESWEKDGQKRSQIVLVANQIEFGSQAKREAGQSQPATATTTSTVDDDDVPF